MTPPMVLLYVPETWIYRVGPQPRGPLYVPATPNNREGLQAREPSKCLNGQSYGERLAKRSIASCMRLDKRL